MDYLYKLSNYFFPKRNNATFIIVVTKSVNKIYKGVIKFQYGVGCVTIKNTKTSNTLHGSKHCNFNINNNFIIKNISFDSLNYHTCPQFEIGQSYSSLLKHFVAIRCWVRQFIKSYLKCLFSFSYQIIYFGTV